jgi:hypothetical protein
MNEITQATLPAIIPFETVLEANLITYTEGRAHFSSTIPGMQIAWDSTSLGDFKTCPRKYYYSHVLGLRSRRAAVPLTFGIHYHAGLEAYDRLRFKGLDHEEALVGVVRAMGEMMGTRTPDPNDYSDNPRTIWHPWRSDDTKRNWFTAMRSVVWYLDHFANDPLETIRLANGKPAVELSFRMEVPQYITPDGVPVLLCGHMDRVANFNGAGLYVVDRKTTSSAINSDYYERYSPDNQMSLYTLAGKVVFQLPILGVIIDAAQVQVNSTRFHRGFVNRTPRQIEEWVYDLGYWIKMAQAYAEARHWPQNDKACQMYNGCAYRGVCSKDPAVRGVFIDADFEHNPWNPLNSRGGD